MCKRPDFNELKANLSRELYRVGSGGVESVLL